MKLSKPTRGSEYKISVYPTDIVEQAKWRLSERESLIGYINSFTITLLKKVLNFELCGASFSIINLSKSGHLKNLFKERVEIKIEHENEKTILNNCQISEIKIDIPANGWVTTKICGVAENIKSC